jgi:hypothetical protein
MPVLLVLPLGGGSRNALPAVPGYAGRVIHRSEVVVPAGAVMKMLQRPSAFSDGGCYFVAVAAWMMTAYRRCQRGECSPAAVSR